MGNTEYVDKLVAEGFFDDVERLKKEMPLLVASMEQLSKAGRDVNAALGSTRTLKDVVENTDKATKVNETASRTVKVLTEDTLKLNMAIKAQNDALKLNVQIAQAQDGSIAKEILLVKQLTAERNRLNLETQKGRAEELKAQIDAKNDWIKSNSDKLSAQKINIGNYPEMMAQMVSLRNEMKEHEKAGLTNTQVYADMEGRLKELSAAMPPTSVQLTSLTNSMTFLAQAGKQDTQEFKDLQQQAMALRVNMNYVKSAVSGTSDALNKQASAAKSSGQATFAMSQIMREMPSFAYSASTGILALSNNIPMLGDSIANLKQKNEELVASGQKAIPVWKSLGLAVFSVNGIITLAVSAITIIAARMAMAGNEAENSAKKVDKLNDSLKEMKDLSSGMSANIATSTDLELNKAQRLIDTYRNGATTAQGRINTYMDLQGMYPRILSALTDEEKRTLSVSKAHEKEFEALSKVIGIKNQMAEQDKMIAADIKARNEATSAMSEMLKGMSPESLRQINRLVEAQQGNTHITSNFPAAGVDNKAINEYLDLRDRTLKIEAAISAWKQSQLELSITQANMEKSTIADQKTKQRDDAENEFQVTLDRYVVLAQTRAQYEAEQEAKFQERLAVTKQMELALQDQRTKALEELNAEYDKNGISFEEYTKRKAALDKNFVYTSLILHREYYKALQKEYPNDERLEKLISDANAAIANLQRENSKAKRKELGSDDMESLIQQGARQSIDTTAALWDGYYQKQINRQEDLLDSIQKRKDAEIEAINLTMQSDEKKHQQIRALTAQTAQQEKQIQAETRRLKREQAQADRVAGVLNVVLNTSIAVAKAYKDYGWPYGLIPAGIIAAMGAAQIATIYAQPLPQYAEGTEDHPGGHALVGEAGKEAIMEPGKAPYIVDKPTVLNLRRHSRVIPEKDLIAGGMGFLTPGLLQQLNVAGGDMTEVKQAIDNSTRSITQAITNKPETTFIASNGEFKKIVKRGNSYITYLNDNFS